MRKKIITFLILLGFTLTILNSAEQQKQNENINLKLITINQNTPFNEALNLIETLSQEQMGKKIVNLSSKKESIGFPINKMDWKDALNLLINLNDLQLEILPGAYIIKDKEEEKKKEEIEKEKKEMINLDSKQVKINSVFFKADISFVRSLGIDWSTLVNGKVVASLNFKGGENIVDDIMTASGTTTLDNGDISVDVNTLLKIVEANQKGTILAKPSVTVLSGREGYIQVGEDFSTKIKDEAGNVAEKFFQTGMILKVVPTVLEENGRQGIYLVADIEKSSATPGEVSTLVNKSQSNTEIMLYDGEETVLGGLYDTERTTVRRGIPILKDLPWWFLGIRYLTGYNKVEKKRQEMLVLIKAEIVDPIEQRKNEVISSKEKIKNYRKDFQKTESLFMDNDLPKR